MAELKLYKMVASLPAVLEPNAIYLVRVGNGFDQYATNSTGTIVSYPLNLPSRSSLGINNVDNTSDANKPISTATQTALDGKQAVNINLTAFANLGGAANKLAYFTGAGALALADFSVQARALLDDADAPAMRTTLGLGSVAVLNASQSTGALTVPQRDASGYLNLGRVVFDFIVNATQPSGNGGGRLFFEVGGNATISPTNRRVALDTSVDQFRIYEAGDSARGVYIDLKTCASSAGSAIWHSGNFDPASKQNALGYTPLNKGGDTLTNTLFAPSTGVIGDATGSKATLQAFGNGTNGAFIALHRSGIYAAYFGLDTDNKLKVGGWSMGNNAYEIWHAGNTPKQSSTSDPTALALLIQGAWGLGGVAIPVAESAMNDNDRPTQFCNFTAGGLGILPLNINGYGYHFDNASAGFAFQEYVPVTLNRKFLRRQASGTYGPWSEYAFLGSVQTWTAKQVFNDYVQLGANATARQERELTGTTASTQGGSVNVPHGVTRGKIVKINAVVDTGSLTVPMNCAEAGYAFSCRADASNIIVTNLASNSANVLSKAITITVTIKE
jgi:hypothetical protein